MDSTSSISATTLVPLPVLEIVLVICSETRNFNENSDKIVCVATMEEKTQIS